MSLKDFEHFGVHDLFKVRNHIFSLSLLKDIYLYIFIYLSFSFNFFFYAMSKFIATSRQAIRLNKTRILLETRIQEVNEESKKWAKVATKAKEKATKLQNLIEELKTDVVEKDTRLDHLQKKNNEMSTLLSKAKGDAVTKFKVSK